MLLLLVLTLRFGASTSQDIVIKELQANLGNLTTENRNSTSIIYSSKPFFISHERKLLFRVVNEENSRMQAVYQDNINDINGPTSKKILSGLRVVKSMVYDWSDNKLFIWLFNYYTLKVYDGTDFKDSSITDYGFICLAIDPDKNFLFLCDENGLIKRTDYNYTKIVRLKSHMSYSVSISLDLQNEHVYAADFQQTAIISMDYNGNNLHTLKSPNADVPVGLVFYDQRLYWFDDNESSYILNITNRISQLFQRNSITGDYHELHLPCLQIFDESLLKDSADGFSPTALVVFVSISATVAVVQIM